MKNFILTFFIALTVFTYGCGRDAGHSNSTAGPTSLSQVSAVRLNFRYEGDVPGPTAQAPSNIEDRNAAIQADFDQNRPQEVLDKTLTSPDKKHVAVVYHRVNDV